MHTPDSTLIEHTLAGDAQAFEMLIERYMQGIFGVCFRICEDIDDAHDVTQEVCIKVMENLKGFEGKAAFKTWVYRIAYTQSLLWLRSKKDHVDLESVEPYLGEADIYDIDERNAELLVQQSIEKLSKIDKSIVLFYYYEDLKIKDIANITGMNENTVKTRLSRAKKFLQVQLEPLWKI